MSRKCELCGKATTAGSSVQRKGLARRKGGGGQHILCRTKRTFRPNLCRLTVKAEGMLKRLKVCSRCLKSTTFARG